MGHVITSHGELYPEEEFGFLRSDRVFEAIKQLLMSCFKLNFGNHFQHPSTKCGGYSGKTNGFNNKFYVKSTPGHPAIVQGTCPIFLSIFPGDNLQLKGAAIKRQSNFM